MGVLFFISVVLVVVLLIFSVMMVGELVCVLMIEVLIIFVVGLFLMMWIGCLVVMWVGVRLLFDCMKNSGVVILCFCIIVSRCVIYFLMIGWI